MKIVGNSAELHKIMTLDHNFSKVCCGSPVVGLLNEKYSGAVVSPGRGTVTGQCDTCIIKVLLISKQPENINIDAIIVCNREPTHIMGKLQIFFQLLGKISGGDNF